MTLDSEEYDLAAPDVAGVVATLSSLGYSLEAAVADLVDNSVSANARNIDVEFTWAGRNSWIAVVDDGDGMTEEQLLTAMTVAGRGPSVERSAADLGRFGVGLKSASFSQARQLTVSTATDGRWRTRVWDVDVVEKFGEWRLMRRLDEATSALLARLRGPAERGTIVLWTRLNGYHVEHVTENDERIQKQFYAEAARTEAHLGMVFARFLSGGRRRTLRVSGTPVDPWDPFLTSNPAVQRLPVEQLPLGAGVVRVEAFVLPSVERLVRAEAESTAAGPRGWLGQQGFYVYRRDRLILAGDWLGLRGVRREEKYNLARIAVDIPTETDVDWGVDVRKASVVPPVSLRPHLRRIAVQARRRAADVLRYRGQIATRSHGDPLMYAWRVGRDNDRISCRINRSHPLVSEVMRSGGSPDQFRALIRLLEETVPVVALRVMHETDSSDDPEPFGGPGRADADAIAVAERVYEALVSGGRSPAAARERLRTMSPFDQLEGFWSR